jgi:hypothetical protein
MQTPENAIRCANCGQRLTTNDKFCRQCGLPTLQQAQAQKRIPSPPPDTGELERALEAQPDPRPFLRAESNEAELQALLATEVDEATGSEPLTTTDMVNATNPTLAVQKATLVLGMIAVLAIIAALAGVVLLALALRP